MISKSRGERKGLAIRSINSPIKNENERTIPERPNSFEAVQMGIRPEKERDGPCAVIATGTNLAYA